MKRQKNFGPSVFDVPVDFVHAIVSWMDEHPEEVAKKNVEEKKEREKEKAKVAEEMEKKNDEAQP